jgi:hypothetical protein
MKIVESAQPETQAALEWLNVVRKIEQRSTDTGDKIAGATRAPQGSGYNRHSRGKVL